MVLRIQRRYRPSCLRRRCLLRQPQRPYRPVIFISGLLRQQGIEPDSQWIDTVTVTIAGGPTYSGKSLVGDFFDLPYGQYTVSATVIYIVNSNGDLTTYVYKNTGRDINLSWESMGLHLGCDLVSKNSVPLPTPTPTTTPSPTASAGPTGTISGRVTTQYGPRRRL